MRTKTGDLPISVDDLKDFLHIDHTDEDAMLQAVVDSAVDYVERATERDLIAGEIVEPVDASMVAGTCVTLRRSPATNLSAVTAEGVTVEPSGYTFRPNSHRRSRVKFKTLPAGEIVVTYQTGMADDPTARQACLWAAAHFYCNREPEVAGNTSQFKLGLDRILKLLGAGGYA